MSSIAAAVPASWSQARGLVEAGQRGSPMGCAAGARAGAVVDDLAQRADDAPRPGRAIVARVVERSAE